MGVAADFARAEMPRRTAHLQILQDRLARGLSPRIPYLRFLGHPTRRLPGNVSVAVEYIEGEAMLLFLDMEGIQISSGSACISRSLKVSHVMLAMGVDAATAQGSLLFSFGMQNKEEDVDRVLQVLPRWWRGCATCRRFTAKPWPRGLKRRAEEKVSFESWRRSEKCTAKP